MQMAIRTTAGEGIEVLLPWMQQQRMPACINKVTHDVLASIYERLVQTLLPLWQQQPLPVQLLAPQVISTELCHQLLVMLQTEHKLGAAFQWTILPVRALPMRHAVIWGAVDIDAACFLAIDSASPLWVKRRIPRYLEHLYVFTATSDWQADWIKQARKHFKSQLRQTGALPKALTLLACLGDVASAQWPLLLALMQYTKIPLIELTGERQCLMWHSQ